MTIGNIEITIREILFSTIIIAVLTGIGVWISNPIVSTATRRALETVSAVKVNDVEKFGYIKRTNVGKFFAEGSLIANDTIILPEINGRYSFIEKVKEEYRTHTQTYTVSDGKGHTSVRTRTYKSWDVMGREKFESASYSFLGESFTKQDIGYRPSPSRDTIIYNRKFWGNDIRYVYYTVPITVDGLLSGVADDKRFNNMSFTEGSTIQGVEKIAEGWMRTAPILFWVLWEIMTFAIVALFYNLENEWLY